MNGKLIATLIALLLMTIVTSAQSYAIRVTYNTNLRASASLQASIIATAPAGTTLNVVGSFNRWLRINRDGSEVWMADWVGYEHVEEVVETTPTQPQTTSNIDNCCFVDRQCATTDEEWMIGYYAYQGNECTAPVQTETTTQPVASTTSQIDNCCFVDRQCTTDQEWTGGYWAFQNNQCGVPAERSATSSSEPNRPRVEGPPAFVRFIEDTLDLLEARSTRWYGYVIDHIDLIAPAHAGDPDDCGAYAYSRDRKITVQSDCPTFMTPYTANLISMASTIVHEACHIYHEEQGITYPEGLPREEWECGKPATEAMKALDARQQYFVGVIQLPFE